MELLAHDSSTAHCNRCIKRNRLHQFHSKSIAMESHPDNAAASEIHKELPFNRPNTVFEVHSNSISMELNPDLAADYEFDKVNLILPSFCCAISITNIMHLIWSSTDLTKRQTLSGIAMTGFRLNCNEHQAAHGNQEFSKLESWTGIGKTAVDWNSIGSTLRWLPKTSPLLNCSTSLLLRRMWNSNGSMNQRRLHAVELCRWQRLPLEAVVPCPMPAVNTAIWHAAGFAGSIPSSLILVLLI
ncbi:hypothetical protein LXL04_012311 [Taraxacum kok-saghyz]